MYLKGVFGGYNVFFHRAFVEAVPKFPFSIFGMFALPPPNPFAPVCCFMRSSRSVDHLVCMAWLFFVLN